jgi:hypothetical protein
VAAVGLLALGACGSEQGAALFVGDERVTEVTLDGYVDGEVASYLEQGATMADISYADSRQQAAILMLLTELGRELELPADTAGAASESEALYLEAVGYYQAISERAEPRAMTNAELEALNAAIEADQSLLETIVQEWAVSQQLTPEQYEQFNVDAQTDPRVLPAVVLQWSETGGAQRAGFADDLNAYMDEYDVAVNPRYGELDISPLPGVFEVAVPQR